MLISQCTRKSDLNRDNSTRSVHISTHLDTHRLTVNIKQEVPKRAANPKVR
jgi:hypothetical protein